MLVKDPQVKILLRRQYQKHQTKGDAILFNERNGIELSFKTLELPYKDNQRFISCIPEGIYNCAIRYSKKYKRHIHITGVEGRSLILIHWGNYAGSINPRTGTPDIKGCILVGDGYADFDGDGINEIKNSKTTFDKIMAALESDSDFKIQIS